MEFYLRNLPNTYTWKKKMIELNLTETNILILGNSMTFCGIIPGKLKYPSFNLANNSQDLYYDYQLTLNYIKHCTSLKYILVPVNYASFEYTLDQGPESWRTSYYREAFNIKSREDHIKINDYSAILMYGFQHGLELTLRLKRISLYDGVDSLGWFNGGSGKLESNDARTAAKGTEEFLSEEKILNYLFIPQNVSFLKGIIELAQKQNIEVVLITPPISRYYSDNIYSDNPILKRQKKIVIDLCEKYRIKYYSYRDDKRFYDRDFSDIKHLNLVGAIKFSELINTEIIN
jgi:hypothetical protein